MGKLWKQWLTDFIFLGSKITTDGDFSHEIKRRLLLGRKAMINLLLLLSRFSCAQLCATSETAVHQAPPSLGFSRQEPWSMGCHFLLQRMKVKSENEVTQSCLTLRDPMDCSLPGSSIHGIFQAKVLEWGAITFSEFIYIYMLKKEQESMLVSRRVQQRTPAAPKSLSETLGATII